MTENEDTLNLLSKVNKALSAEYAARESLAAAREVELREELAALAATRAAELAEAEGLRSRLEMQASLEAQLLAAGDERRQGESKLADAHAELSRLRAHLVVLEAEGERFKATIGELQQQLRAADAEIVKERALHSDLRLQLEIATNRLGAAEDRERAVRSQVKALDEKIDALTLQAKTYENELEHSRAANVRTRERGRMLLRAISADLEAASQIASDAERREQDLLRKLESLEAARVAGGELEQRVRLLEERSAQSVAEPADQVDSDLTPGSSQICAEDSIGTVEEPTAEIRDQAGLLEQGIDDALLEDVAMTASSLDDLLEHYDEAFVKIAYFVLLRRQVDPTGLGHYTKYLRQGGNRLQVLADLSNSAEARVANVEVQGLKSALRWHRIKKFLLLDRLVGVFAHRNRPEEIQAIENRLVNIEAQLLSLRAVGVNTRPIAAPVQAVSGHEPELVVCEVPVAEVQPAAVPAEVSLDEDFSLSAEQWHLISGSLFDRLWPKWSGKRPGQGTAAERRLVVVVSGEGDKESSTDRHGSLEDLRSNAAFDVAVFELGAISELSKARGKSRRTLAELGEILLPTDLVLFIEAGDEVDSRLALALELGDAWDRDFVLSDQMFSDGDRLRLISFHGVDARHHAYCDYFSSRFIASGRAIINALPDATSVPELARRILGAVGHDLRRVLHLPFPLLKIGGLNDELIRQRRVALMHDLSKSHVKADKKFTRSVSAIICTKDGGYLLNALVSQLLTMEQIGEIIIISNNTSGDYTIGVLDELSRHERCKIVVYNKPFSFSEQCNLGAKASSCDHLLFMNDDIGPIGTDWLDYLLGDVESHPNRIVGPLLLYPDQSAQHAGMFLGFHNCAGHAYRHLKHPHGASMFELVAPRRVSCLTAACMLMKREVFEALNGFDQMLAHTFQDVDLSLRALFSGVELLFDPRAILFHFESVTVKPTLLEDATMQLRGREHAYFFKRWGSELQNDAWHNRSLSTQDESLHTIKVAN